jgi:hypothetical protein
MEGRILFKSDRCQCDKAQALAQCRAMGVSHVLQKGWGLGAGWQPLT